ncbi:MAG TPA: potassium-transporting ATPase subunit F [Stellaceae bacterium]|nr:potassium-transporting ATPase subunit F [Stellaceae bacterium]
MSSPAKRCEASMLDNILGGLVSLIITVYLIIALVRPEKF